MAVLDGVNKAFVTLYWILTGVMVGALLVTLVLSLYGFVRFAIESTSQAVASRINRSLVVADTFEYATLYRAYRTKARANDPYLVYTQEDLMNGVFYVLAVLIVLIGLQVGVTMASSVYSLFRKSEPLDITFDLPPELLVVLGVTVVTALLVTWTGLSLFSKNVSQRIAGAQSRVDAFNAFVFDHLSSNPVFLGKLLGDDPQGAFQVLTETDLTADALTRGIFTINLWQYFRNRMPDANPMWEEAKALFSVDAINTRTMDLTPYVSYSLYSAIPNSLFDEQGQMPVPSAMVDQVTDAVQSLMSRSNQLLHNLNPSGLSSSFVSFLVVRTLVLVLALGSLLVAFLYRYRLRTWMLGEGVAAIVAPSVPAPGLIASPVVASPSGEAAPTLPEFMNNGMKLQNKFFGLPGVNWLGLGPKNDPGLTKDAGDNKSITASPK